METISARGAAATSTADPDIGSAAPRGSLRIYMGATPGSGKTYAMLREGHDRAQQGEDVVIAFVETHGRPRTEAALAGLEVVPRRCQDFRGRPCEDMDLEGVLRRHPKVALVDELAHTNLPGARNQKRWQDIEALRDAGVDVVSTVNVQAVESVKDVVEAITGIPVRDTIPDQVIDGADEVQFIDISPEALRKRMRHGNIYAPEKVDIALANFFRPGNLAALREIALRLLAQTMGRATGTVRGTPQDVLVAVSGRASSEALIRRAARMARRFGGFCTVLHVDDLDDDASPEIVARLEALTGELQARWRRVTAKSVGEALVTAAHDLGVQHVLVGESAPEGFMGRFRKGLLDRLLEELPDVSLHVIAPESRHRRPAHAAHPAQPTQAAAHPRPTTDHGEAPMTVAQAAALRGPGALRLYIGYARGTGITTSMLEEGRRRASRGADVVVASVLLGGGADPAAASGLEVLGPPEGPALQGRLDVEALLRRRPAVACIDELARPGTDGQPAAASLGRILDAGITIVATLHLTDLESTRTAMGDRLAPLPPDRHPISDDVLGLAGEVELVDVTPHVLIERLRRGEILPLADVPAALQGDFRADTLAALRELCFRVIAGHTDKRLVAYMRERSIEAPWEARPRVMTCVEVRSDQDMGWLIRRSAALTRAIDGDLEVVTVGDRPDSARDRQTLDTYRGLTRELGGEFVTIRENHVAAALADHARKSLATEVIVTRGRVGRGTLRELIRTLTEVDIHVLSAAEG